MAALTNGVAVPVRSNRIGIFHCIIGTGTASIAISSAGVTGDTTVKTFTTDEVIRIEVPAGQLTPTITGDAQLAVNWGDPYSSN